MRKFEIPGFVRTKYGDNGQLVVINVRSGHWHALNPVAAAVFEVLVRTGDAEPAIAQLAERFPETSEERVRRDVERLVGMLLERHLLATTVPPARHPGSVLMALPASGRGGLSMADRVLASVCFAVALVLLKLPLRISIFLVSRVKGRCARKPASVEQGHDAISAAREVTRLFPGRVACMELSLTAVLIMAARGRALEWTFGFSSDPLAFHSWVCANGTAVVHHADEPLEPGFSSVFVV